MMFSVLKAMLARVLDDSVADLLAQPCSYALEDGRTGLL
jgi:hypothetical protein